MKSFKKSLVVSSILLSLATAYADNSQDIPFPTPNAASPDSVMSNYTSQLQGADTKTIALVNNTNAMIYPVLRAYSSPDGHEYRIYVGHKDQNGHFMLGLPASTTPNVLSEVTVTVPSQLWNAGQVEIFNVPPAIPTLNTSPSDSTALYAIDTSPQSTNDGDLIYRNNTALGFNLDSAYQLVEYTIGNNFVDYDVSYVDHLYMPVALEVNGGTIGYIGSDLSLQTMQNQIQNFVAGQYTNGYFSNETDIGWPSFYNPEIAGTYTKIPAAYNIFALANSFSTFDSSKMMLQVNQINSSENAVLNGVVNRWLGWVSNYQGAIPAGAAPYGGYFAATCGNDNTCTAFADTVTHIWNLAQQQFPNLTPPQLVEKILGYDFPANFDDGADDQPQPIYPDNPNAFRDAVKSVLRGVPYPYWNYGESQWYPNPNATVNGQDNPSQKYNLDPIVWFVHQDLGMAGYGFSIDDDIGNVEVPGNGFTIAVGGLAGLQNKNIYNPTTQQAILIGSGTTIGSGWTSMTSTNLGNCQLNQGTGTDCPVSLNPEAASSAEISLNAPTGTLSLNVTYGPLSNGIYPLVLAASSCKVTGSLDPDLCTPAMLHADPNNPQFFIIPVPTNLAPVPPLTSATLYWATGWNSISGCGINESDVGGNASAHAFNFLPSTQSCTVTLSANQAEATLKISYDTQGNVTGANCEVGTNTCKAPPFFNATTVNIATPGAL